jgi:hypothetical protein
VIHRLFAEAYSPRFVPRCLGGNQRCGSERDSPFDRQHDPCPGIARSIAVIHMLLFGWFGSFR